MATSTILSNPEVKFGAVDLTGWCTSAVFTKTVTALNDTVFGNTSNTFTAGLEDNELTVTLFLSYAASATYATLAPLVGTKFNVTVKPTSAADSATNPAFTLTNTEGGEMLRGSLFTWRPFTVASFATRSSKPSLNRSV